MIHAGSTIGVFKLLLAWTTMLAFVALIFNTSQLRTKSITTSSTSKVRNDVLIFVHNSSQNIRQFLNTTTGANMVLNRTTSVRRQRLKTKRFKLTKFQKKVKNFYKITNKTYPYVNKFVINGSDVCRPNSSLVILIPSRPGGLVMRETIRRTWGGVWPGHAIKETLSLAFVFGLDASPAWNARLLNESLEYGDVIQGDFLDAYQNLTRKTLLMLKWFITFCPRAKYLLKLDDDVIINLPLLLSILANQERTLRRTVMGRGYYDSKVHRGGKFEVSEVLYPFPLFPPYTRGPTYVISGDLVGELLNISQHVPPINIEDAYVTGILVTILRARILNDIRFGHQLSLRPTSACDIVKNKIISGANMTPDLLMKIWKHILNPSLINNCY